MRATYGRRLRWAAVGASAGAALVVGGAAFSAGGWTPSFARMTVYRTGRVSMPSGGFDVAELNGDHRVDMAVDYPGRSSLDIFLNRGNGSFRPVVRHRLRGGLLGLVDMNGDGRRDVVMARNDTISVLLNRGDGSFPRHVDSPDGGASVGSIGDLNGDGSPDLYGVDDTNAGVMLNKGDGSFTPGQEYPLVDAEHDVAAGDVNGDGKPDLVVINALVASGEDSVSVLLNRGDGTFLPRADYDALYPQVLRLADLNGDGRKDVIVGAEDNAVRVLISRADGTLEHVRSYRTKKDDVQDLAVGDVNGDGHPDIVTANEAARSSVSVLLNRGNGTFRPHRDYPVHRAPEYISLLDLNGDGKLDIATEDRQWELNDPFQEVVSVLLNRGNGTFAGRLDYLAGESFSAVRIADLNGDRRPDFAISDANGKYVGVRLDRSGLCNVQDVDGMTLAGARRLLSRGNCRAGALRYAYSLRVRRGGVISQKPAFGAVRPNGAAVDLLVSAGR